MRILTGIDLPLAPSCGSMILCDDLYRISRAETEFMALPGDRTWSEGFDRITDLAAEKAPYGPGFDAYTAALTEQVAKTIAARRPHVIHAQHLGFGLALAFARARGDIPMVAIAHGTDVIEAGRTEQARRALREIVAASHSVIVPTTFMHNAVADLVDEQYRDRITVASWGIPRDRIATAAHSSGRSELRLLHAGRLDANKGTRFAIEALIHADNQEHTLTVIGDGPERDNLAAYAHSLGLAARVSFEPFMPRAVLWQRFKCFDAFAMTTLGIEAFGLVSLEAQAHRLPVIYSAVEGLINVLGESGLPYTPGNARDMARRLNLLTYDPAARIRYGEASQRNASRFSMRALSDKVMALSTNAISGRTPSTPRECSPAGIPNSPW